MPDNYTHGRGGGGGSYPSSPVDPDYVTDASTLPFIVSSVRSLSVRRRLILLSAFVLGLLLTTLMKHEHLLWVLTTAAGAVPLLQWGQGSVFDSPGLRFGVNRKFSITIFEDLHFGEECWGNPELSDNDPNTLRVMNTVLDQEDTNLVVLNGDLLSGEAFSSDNYTAYIDHIVDPLVQRKIPWASTYGNHDRTRGTSPAELLKQERARGQEINGKRLAWTDSMVAGDDAKVGTTNYYLPIYASTGGGNPEIAMLLWFFDSRAGSAFKQTTPDAKDVPIEDWVDQKVVTWFALEKRAFKTQLKRDIPSIAFVHIPIEATRELQQQANVDESTRPGLDAEIIGHQANSCDGNGNCHYSKKDSAFMNELAKTDGLMAVFSGHDHGIDWCMQWSKASTPKKQGIHLCFGRHTGYGGYGKQWKRGARKVVIDEKMMAKKKYELETWIRIEDGSISGHVTLNSTYGQDVYSPAEANSLGDQGSKNKPSSTPKV